MNGCHVPRLTPAQSQRECAWRGFRAIPLLLAAVVAVSACAVEPKRAERPAAPALPPRAEEPDFFRLPGIVPDHTLLRVAMLLPLSSSSAETRAVANGIEKAAELALFDAGNPDILLMPRDDGGTPEAAATAAERAIAEGAEIILGPLFANSVTAVAPVASARGVPVVAFSSDRAVGGGGVYLLSFQPEDEVRRIIAYAAQQGRNNFAALVPRTAYGEKVTAAFRQTVADASATVTAIETFAPKPEEVGDPVRTVAASRADAILIAQGGVMLRSIAPTLAISGASNRQVKFLGTGLWDDTSILREPMLAGGWFAAPSLEGERAFAEKFKANFGVTPPRIASLGYDAMSLVALLAKGTPYQRFTPAALTNPNGFAGVDGIFRFHENGSAERGLAVMEVQPGGFAVVSPAPTTFQPVGL